MPDSVNPVEKNREHKAENLLVNLLFNIVVPTLILTKFSTEEYLGTTNGILAALAFPIIYGLKDLLRSHKWNLFSVLGVVSICLTGGISLLGLAPKYLAIKEAAIPSIFGLATLVSLKTPYPLVKTFIYNDTLLDTHTIKDALSDRGTTRDFEQRLKVASWLVAASFFLSATLNYILAISIVTSNPGTVAYNEELGKMTALSFPVIALPATLVMIGAMLYLFKGITSLTGLSLEEVIRHKEKDG